MNNEIDSLSFKINISGLSKEQNEQIRSLGKALSFLSKKLADADFTKLADLKIPEIDPFTGEAFSLLAKGLNRLNNVLKRSDFSKLSQLKNTPINIFQMIGQGGGGNLSQEAKGTDDYAEAVNNLAVAIDKIKDIQKKSKKTGKTLGLNEEVKKQIRDNKELSAITKQLGIDSGSDKESKKGSKDSNRLLKTLKRIKLIAFIKLIRGALNSIIKGFQSGIQQLAIYSKDFNSTMSQMTTNFTKINASLSLTVQPLLEALQPVISALTDVFVDMGNAISKANAQAKGLSTYTKVSSKYAEDYAKSMQKGTLFSFDTFNTLNAQQSPYETALIDEEDNEEANTFLDTIKLIKEAGETIANLVKALSPYINKILKALVPILNTIMQISNRATNSILPSLGKILDFVAYIVEALGGLINDILIELEPIIQAINNDLIPPLLDLLITIIKPIIELLKSLPIKEIVGLIVEILTPAITRIGKIISFVVTIIGTVLQPILDIINPVLQQVITAIKKIIGLLSPILDSISTLMINLFDGNAWKRLFAGIFKLLASLLDWFINRCIEAINLIIANDIIKGIVNFFGGDWQGITWRSNMADNITIPDYETDFFGANGSPFTSSSQLSAQNYTSNETQMAKAFEQAIYNTGLLDTIESAGNISIDGRDIAQSQNFKREINRTNPNLGIR